MSSLPKQKKSADEIAKLRESLGLPSSVAPAHALPTSEFVAPLPSIPTTLPALEPVPVAPPPPTPALTTLQAHPPQPSKQVRSLKRSERLPILAAEPSASTPLGGAATHELATKIVRSLRKSEQAPLASSGHASADSSLPGQRHSDQEIARLRRNEMLAQQQLHGPPPTRFGYLAWVLPGYLAVLFGVILTYFYELSPYLLCTCLSISGIFAAFILWKKPLLKHHGAFIAVMSLLAGVFAALYYFPQLRYGT